MQDELSLQEKIFYSLSILTGMILLAIVTPSLQIGSFSGSGAKAIDKELLLFCICCTILCFLLHFRRMALWIIRVRMKKMTKGNGTSGTRWIMDEVVTYTALFLKGTAPAAWIIAIASFSFQVYLLVDAILARRKLRKQGVVLKPIPPGQVLFGFTNPFNRIIMIVPAGIVYEKINQSSAVGTVNNLFAAAMMLLVYFTIACFISSMTIVLRERKSPSSFPAIFTEHYSDIFVYILMLCPLGLLAAIMYQQEPWALILFLIPILSMHRAMKNIEIVFDEYKDFLYSLAYAMEARDHYTYGHSERVAKYSKAIAIEMDLPGKQIEDIEKAGKIHDLGKLVIPDAILNKPGRLDEQEYLVMKGHINALKHYFGGKKRLAEVIPVDLASSHHERYDGKGYIIGKKGNEIPLGGRILCVADVFDALTTDRPYREGLSIEEAVEYIKKGSGSHFDPDIVKVFHMMFQKGLLNKLAKEPLND